MKKKGFTLIELLAVIAILAVLVIIVLPNVMDIFNESKKKTFLIEVQSVFKSADMKYMKQSINEEDGRAFYRFVGDENIVPLSGRNQIYYYVKINNSGKITHLLVWDNSYTLKKEDLSGINIAQLSENDIYDDIDTSNINLNNVNDIFN